MQDIKLAVSPTSIYKLLLEFWRSKTGTVGVPVPGTPRLTLWTWRPRDTLWSLRSQSVPRTGMHAAIAHLGLVLIGGSLLLVVVFRFGLTVFAGAAPNRRAFLQQIRVPGSDDVSQTLVTES
jgi:hypothetical protein